MSIHVSVHTSVHMSAHMSIHMFVHVSRHVPIHMSMCRYVGECEAGQLPGECTGGTCCSGKGADGNACGRNSFACGECGAGTKLVVEVECTGERVPSTGTGCACDGECKWLGRGLTRAGCAEKCGEHKFMTVDQHGGNCRCSDTCLPLKAAGLASYDLSQGVYLWPT